MRANVTHIFQEEAAGRVEDLEKCVHKVRTHIFQETTYQSPARAPA